METVFAPTKHTEWICLDGNLSLENPSAVEVVRSLPNEPGVYLWTLCTKAGETALYIGRAASLAKRIYNYIQPFQPHSPNDRKLYFVQKALRRRTPDAKFSLYWQSIPKSELSKTESAAIRQFNPVLNARSIYSKNHTEKLEFAYAQLYNDVVSYHFGDA